MTTKPGAPRTVADVAFDAVHTGAIGGSLVALWFLVADVLAGHPLFTPSLMGSVLFAGAAADVVSGVRLDMVAYYTLVHFAVFGALGAVISIVVYEVELHAKHPIAVLAVLFIAIELAFLLLAPLALPGVIARLGFLSVLAANALAAAGITLFLVSTHAPDTWERVKHVAHLA